MLIALGTEPPLNSDGVLTSTKKEFAGICGVDFLQLKKNIKQVMVAKETKARVKKDFIGVQF